MNSLPLIYATDPVLRGLDAFTEAVIRRVDQVLGDWGRKSSDNPQGLPAISPADRPQGLVLHDFPSEVNR